MNTAQTVGVIIGGFLLLLGVGFLLYDQRIKRRRAQLQGTVWQGLARGDTVNVGGKRYLVTDVTGTKFQMEPVLEKEED